MKKVINSFIIGCTVSYGSLIESSLVNSDQKGVAVGTFAKYEQALNYSENFFAYETFIKSTQSGYYVVFVVNIPKQQLAKTLLDIRNISPSAYIASDERIKELNESNLQNKEESTAITQEQPQQNLQGFDFFIDHLKSAIKLTTTINEQFATDLSQKYPYLNIYAKKIEVYEKPIYDIFAVNIPNDQIKQILEFVKTNFNNSVRLDSNAIKQLNTELSSNDTLIPRSAKLDLSYNLIQEPDAVVTKQENTTTKTPIYLHDSLKTAISYFKNKQYPQALKILQTLTIEDPNNTTINFYLGRSYYELGHYEQASAAFERITIVDEKNLRAKLELAQTYLMLNLNSNALQTFQEVLQNQIPNNVRNTVLKKIEQIKDREQKNFFSAMVSVGINRDTNIQNVTDAKQITLYTSLGSFDSTLNTQKYPDTYMTYLANGNLYTKLSEKVSMTNSLTYVKQTYDKDDQRLNNPNGATSIEKEDKKELELLSYSLSFSKAYTENYLLSLGVDYTTIDLANKDYFDMYGISFGYQKSFYSKNSFFANLKYFEKRFDDPTSQLNSKNYQILIGNNIYSKDYGKTGFLYIYNVEDMNYNNTVQSDKKKHTIMASNSYELYPQIYWNNSINFTYYFENDLNSLYQLTREDLTKIFSTGLLYTPTQAVDITTNFKKLENKSNIVIYTYDKNIFDMTFRYKF
ncbi:MAG: tetratricopeptide repeat protein [Campylobacterales bacterium]|nr:tetratricopeptide repeat protein [Campylobacterales bacterium]